MSGDLDGVVEVVGDVGGEGDDEVAAEGVGDAGEGVEAVPGAPPSSRREMTDWVGPMRCASSRWLSPAWVRRS